MTASVLKAQESEVVKEIKVEKLPFKIESRTDAMLPEILFDDGRIAHVVVGTMPAQTFDVGMDIVESNCGKNIPTKCSTTYSILNYELKLVWKSHPDAKKIGKPLVNKGGQEILTDTQSFSFSDKKKYEKFYKEIGLKDPEFSCSKWEWLNIKSDKIQLLEWSAETMAQNSESDINENQSFMAVMDLTLRKKSKNIYVVGYPKKVIKSSFVDSGFILVAGDVVGWTVQLPNNESCEVSIKPDLTSAIAEFNKTKYSEPKPILKNSPLWDKYKYQNYSNDDTFKYLTANEDLAYLQMLKLIYSVISQNPNGNNILTVTPKENE